MSSKILRGLAGLTLTTSVFAIAAPAFAQLDEIVVTAQKKEENLQDVPVAITAFDLEQLTVNRIEGIEDLGTFTPGVYVTQNPADPNGVRVYIRGIGTFDPQVGQDSRVAIYQDGVYLGKTQGLGFDMPDLARVEILKGPQGTLYGRNTVAGAVNLISAKPDPSEFSAKIKGEYGNYNHKRLTAAMNAPLADNAAVRLSGTYMDRDGWVENTGPGVDFGGEKKYGLRGAIGFDVGDEVNIEFAADYNKTEKEPLFYQSFGPGAQPFAAAITSFDNGRQETTSTSFENEAGDLETMGVSATATWDINETDELKFIAAYRGVESSRFVTLIPTANPAIVNAITGGFNQALAPLPFAFGATGGSLRSDFVTAFSGVPAEHGLFLSQSGGQANLPDHNQYSLELTYNGELSDGRVEYTGGAFLYNESTGTGENAPNPANANDYLFVLGAFNPLVTPPDVRNFLTGFGVPASAQGPIPGSLALLNFLQIPGPIGQQAYGHLQTLNGFNQLFLSAARQSASNELNIDTTALAIYGQATFHVTDNFRITGGLRYSDESKDGVGQAKSPFFNDNIDLTGNIILPNIASFDDSVLDPALTLEYDINEDMMVYASYKESFRSGGFNNGATANRITGQTYGADFIFGREDIVSYEAGFKGDFGDKVRLNAAGFYYDFSNKQTTAGDPLIATTRAVVNTDEEIWGFEADTQIALNEMFTLRGSYSYVDGDTDPILNPFTQQLSTRDQLQGTPKNSYLVAIDYNNSVGNKDIFGNVSYSHKDEILSVPENNLRLPAIDVVSGRVGVGFPLENGAQATLSLWGTNLLDEEYLIDGLPFNTFAYETKVYGQPRSYGVTLGLDF